MGMLSNSPLEDEKLATQFALSGKAFSRSSGIITIPKAPDNGGGE